MIKLIGKCTTVLLLLISWKHSLRYYPWLSYHVDPGWRELFIYTTKSPSIEYQSPLKICVNAPSGAVTYFHIVMSMVYLLRKTMSLHTQSGICLQIVFSPELQEEEHRRDGSVKRSVFIKFFLTGAGPIGAITFVIAQVLAQSTSSMFDWWLAYWWVIYKLFYLHIMMDQVIITRMV